MGLWERQELACARNVFVQVMHCLVVSILRDDHGISGAM